MKINLLKSGKSALTYVLAFCVLAVSLFTASVAVNADDTPVTPPAVQSWDVSSNAVMLDDSYLTDATGEENDPYIISSPAQLFHVAKSGDATAGKYYKIADGITTFYMNNPTRVGGTPADAFAYLSDSTSGRTGQWNNTYGNAFQGHFDGNGITIYGIYCYASSAGLFAEAKLGAVIENVKITNSYFESNSTSGATGAGAIVGRVPVGTTESITIRNCASVNNKIVGGFAAAGIIGNARGHGGTISNCLVINDAEGASITAPNTAGLIAEGWTAKTVENSVAIGIAADGNHTNVKTGSQKTTYTNVYSNTACNGDGTGITVITDSTQLKGEAAKTAMSTLDWANTWVATASYPDLRVFHDIDVIGDENGHKTVCLDDGCTTDFGGYAAHGNWTAEFKCGICEYACPHTTMIDNGEASGADCINGGVMNTKCDLGCGYTSTRPIPALGHDFDADGDDQDDIIAAVGATCKDTGNVEYKHCSVCDKNFNPATGEEIADVTTPVDANAHVWGAEDSVVACNGVHTYFKKCSECGKYAYGADSGTGSAPTPVYDYANLKDVAPVAADHAWGTEQTKVSECESVPSVKFKECGVCGRFTVDNGTTVTDTEPAAPAGHDWSEEKTSISECDPSKNVTYKECKNECGKYTRDNGVTTVNAEAIVAAGHNTTTVEFGEGSGHFITECADCTYATLYVKLETEEYSVFADAGVFEPGTTVSMDKKGDMLAALKELGIDAKDAVWYDISAEAMNGDPIQPVGSVTVKVAVPSTFSTNVKYYHIYKDGQETKCDPLTLSEGEIVLDHFSAIVVADLGVVEEEKEENKKEDTSSTTSTEDKKDETTSSAPATEDKAPEKAPATGDNLVVVVAGIALVIAAAFVLVRKSRKA